MQYNLLHSPNYQGEMDNDLFSHIVNLTSLIAWGMKNRIRFLDNNGELITCIQKTIECIDNDCLIIQTTDEYYLKKLQKTYIELNNFVQKKPSLRK